MIIFKHELRQGKVSLIVWTGAIAFMLAICVFVFPMMSDQMDAISESVESMGSLTSALGVDGLDFSGFMGFYANECSSLLGLGGGFFAALLGISSLSKEEKGKTAEFLLTHPVSRVRVVTEKLLAVIAQILILNMAVLGICAASMLICQVSVEWDALLLLHAACLIMQIELAVVTFAFSAFLRRGGIGVGIGLAAGLYFLNIIANLTEETKFLKYITPYSYISGGDIMSSGSIDMGYLSVGLVFMVLGVLASYLKYTKKDIS